MSTPHDPTLILLGQVLQKIFSITPSPYDTLPILVSKVQTAMGQSNTPYDKLEKALLEIGAGLPNGVLAAALAYLTPAVSNPALTDIVAYWKLDETGNVQRIDASGNGHHLNTSGTTTSPLGKIGNGWSGSGSFLTTDDAVFSGAFPFTVFCWVSPATISATQTILGHMSVGLLQGWRLKQRSDNRFLLDVNGAEVVHTTPVTEASFFLVIASITSATNATIRVNNGSDVSGTIGVPTNPVTPFRVGSDSAGGTYNGVIDEVGVFNRVLSSAEKDALYNLGAGKQYPFT